MKYIIACLLLISLLSCQKAEKKAVKNISPDRTHYLTAPGAVSEPGIISGQVLNLTDDSAIAGAVVIIRNGTSVITTAVTDANGFFRVIGLPQNEYQVTATKNDFSALTFKRVPINSGKEVVTHFILTPVTSVEYVRLS